jgi:hypothetical protein
MFQRVVEYFVVQKTTKPKTDHYFQNPQHKTMFYNRRKKLKKNMEKCPSRYNESYLHSREMFTAHKDPKSECIFMKNL